MSDKIQTKIQTDSDSTYDHVLKYTGLFGGVQGLTILMGVIRNKLVALLLGPAGTGLISIFNTMAQLVHQSTNMGIPFSGVRQMAELSESEDIAAIHEYAKTVRTWSLLTGLFGTLICCSLAWYISFWMFEDYEHTLEICLLSPMIAMMTVTGGELAILKGLKQLKKVALTSVFAAFSTLIICLPVYSLMGMDGIVPSLLLCNAVAMLINIHFASRVVPWHINLRSWQTIKNGGPMLTLGIGYIIAGMFGQGAELIIRTQILQFSDETFVGLYQCGYILMVSYASVVFVAFEADFFPRLSSAANDMQRANKIINQQMEISVLLISPILISFVLAMPYIVRVLYSDEFLAAVPMSISAIFFMFFKALIMPAAYLPLAKGDSKMYMFTELIYDIFIAIAIPFAFLRYGLIGAGWTISIGGLLDMLIIHIIYRWKYGYRFSPRLLNIYILQFMLLAATISATLFTTPLVKWIVGVITFVISAYVSLRILRRETNIIDTVLSKIKERKQ